MPMEKIGDIIGDGLTAPTNPDCTGCDGHGTVTMNERHELFIYGGLAHAATEQSFYNLMKFTWNVNGKDRIWYVWADDKTMKDEADVLAELLSNYQPIVTEGV